MTNNHVNPVSSGYLNSDEDHSIFFSTYGNKKGAPLLLIHGGFGFTLDISKLEALDFNKNHIIEIHQRGAGNSKPYASLTNNSLQDNVNDMESLRNHLNVEKWSILSWSAGNILMGAYAGLHPERCDELTAYAPYFAHDLDYQIIKEKDPVIGAAYFDYHNAKTGLDVVRSVFYKAASPNIETRLKTAFQAACLWDNNLSEKEFYASKTTREWDNYFASYLLGAKQDLELFEAAQHPLTENKITTPTTLYYGSDDLWSATHAFAKAVYPHAEIKHVPNGQHDIHSETVQNFIKLDKKF
jgi:proline iminopeptidase